MPFLFQDSPSVCPRHARGAMSSDVFSDVHRGFSPYTVTQQINTDFLKNAASRHAHPTCLAHEVDNNNTLVICIRSREWSCQIRSRTGWDCGKFVADDTTSTLGNGVGAVRRRGRTQQEILRSTAFVSCISAEIHIPVSVRVFFCVLLVSSTDDTTREK